MEKEFKTIEEQIEILKNKNLIISSKRKAYRILENNNYYYLINGYKELFVDKANNCGFITGTKLEELYAIYNFDGEIRLNFLKYILLIERRVNTYIAYEFSKQYGHKNYLANDNFNCTSRNEELIKKFINDINLEIKHQCKNGNSMLLHYIKSYKYIPLWVLIRIMTFGKVSKFYSFMKHKEQDAVARKFNIKRESLRVYLINLAIIRNVCAHDEKLYDIKLKLKISANKYHSLLNIDSFKGNYTKGVKDLFSVVLMLKELLEEKEFKRFYKVLIKDIGKLKKKIHVIKFEKVLNKMGFPINYIDMFEL